MIHWQTINNPRNPHCHPFPTFSTSKMIKTQKKSNLCLYTKYILHTPCLNYCGIRIISLSYTKYINILYPPKKTLGYGGSALTIRLDLSQPKRCHLFLLWWLSHPSPNKKSQFGSSKIEIEIKRICNQKKDL